MEHWNVSPPYNLVDKILDLIPGKSCHGLRYISFSEVNSLFSSMDSSNRGGGGIPFPQTLLIETFAQFFITAICSEFHLKHSDTRLFEVKTEFHRQCFVGDCLEVFAEIKINRQGIFIGTCRGYVENNLIAEAKLKILVPAIWSEYN